MQENQENLVTTVTEDDDDAATTGIAATSTNTTVEASAHDDQLRVAAEKRRQKILQQANTRMSMVEGTYSAAAAGATTTTISGTAEEITSVAGVVDDITAKIVDGVESSSLESVAAESPATTESTSTSTTSSRLAAMRRRRFQKKTPTIIASTTASIDENKPVSISDKINPNNTEGIESMKEDEAVVVTMNPSTEQTTVDESTGNLEPKVDDTTSTNTTTSSSSSSTKKYMGVAKMRRRMNKERQEQQQQFGGDEHSTLEDTSAMSTITSTMNTTTTTLPRKKQRSMMTTLPILMYAMTTVVLFVTGLHIGLQQGRINYCYTNSVVMVNDDATNGYCYNTANTQQWSIMVHSELAPRKMGGLQRVLSTMNIGGTTQNIPPVTANTLKVDATKMVYDEEHNDDTEDEFDTTTESTSKTIVGTIDPLFQVDLDAYTAGDGLYFTLGRFAVRIHRSILMIFYYTPQSIIRSILSFMWSFVQTPPVLFVMALLIRHGLGKSILGAKLPISVVDETQHKDILSTVKAFVMKFLLSSFPTITIFYEVWTYIRSDMYVMLCGLFVGIALSHHHQAGSPYGEATTLATTLTTTTTDTIVNGISDEL